MIETIYLDDPAKLQTVFNDLQDVFAVADYTDPLREKVVPLLAAEHEEYFNRESGPLGKWPALSPVTVRAKGFDTILIEQNNMRSSLLFDGPNHIEEVSSRDLKWGTSDEKAAKHQEGIGVPQRAFVGTSETTVEKISGVVASAAVAILKAG